MSGKCLKRGPGYPCSSNSSCPTGYSCLIVQRNATTGYCFQECTNNQGVCLKNTDGRTTCLPLARDQQTGKILSFCVKEAKKGEKCGLDRPEQAICKRGQKPQLYCSRAKKVCEEVVVQTKAGDPCNKDGDLTEPIRICDRDKNLACNQQGKCEVAQLAKEGEECDSFGKYLSKPTICDPKVKNLACISFVTNGDVNRCHIICDPQKPNQCSHNTNLTCVKVFSDGRGLCLDVQCSKDSDCAFKSYTCEKTRTGNMCYPPYPVGPNDFGQICSVPYRKNGCKKGLFCATLLRNGQKSMCVKFCKRDSDCPSYSGYSVTCYKSSPSSSEGVCLIKCKGIFTKTCPKNLSCISNYCVAK